MRKIIALEQISLDGIIQSPGGPDEDTSKGFTHGEWIAPYADEVLGAAIRLPYPFINPLQNLHPLIHCPIRFKPHRFIRSEKK